MSKPRPVSLATATFLLVGVLALIGIGGRLGFDLLRASVRREPQRCFFASEAIWDICRTWLPAPSSTPSPSTGELDQTGYVKGIYVSYYALGSPELMARVKDLLENTELNAIVMDVKGDRGFVAYSTEVPLAKEIGADGQVMVRDWPEFLRWFKDRRVYTIARIVTFKDNLLSAAHPEWAVRDSTTGRAWKDGEGLGWGDPNRREVQDYNIALAVEAAKQGFDEIQFDYVRFPSDGAVGRAVFSGPNTQADRVSTIAAFLGRARQALAPYKVKVAADTFGYVAWQTGDMGIGQVIEEVAPSLDVLSPMLYPSTFAYGLPNDGGAYRNAIAFPYDIVQKSTFRAAARARAVNSKIVVRPWIQDFADYAFDGRTYTAGEIRAQMEGAREGGGRGWLLWDPTVKYTRDAVVSARVSYPPNVQGFIPVLRYRGIARPATGVERTPEGLRSDLERLLAAGYYPVTVRQMVEERLSMVPAGKRPVVLIFDGALPGHFRLLPDGSVDGDSAAGILKAFHDAHPADWPLRATFFVAPDGDEPGATIFGQGESAKRKLAVLVQWGIEVGSSGMGGGVSSMTAADVQRELGLSQTLLERWLPGYRVFSFSPSDGALPRDKRLLAAGEYGGMRYSYGAVVAGNGGLAPSPFASSFDPFAIPRVDAAEAELERWLTIAERPGAAYVSAGE